MSANDKIGSSQQAQIGGVKAKLAHQRGRDRGVHGAQPVADEIRDRQWKADAKQEGGGELKVPPGR